MATYATTSDYNADRHALVVELLIFDDLIFHCIGDPPIWVISVNCMITESLHRILNELTVNTNLIITAVCNLTKLDIAKYELWAYGIEHAPSDLIRVLCQIRETYAFNQEADYFQVHKLDGRWDTIANRIRAELY